MIDQVRLREALDRWDHSPAPIALNHVIPFVEAARLVADPDTLVISKVDGEWVFGPGLATAAQAAYELDGEVLEDGTRWDDDPSVRGHYLLTAAATLHAYFDALLAQQTGDTK